MTAGTIIKWHKQPGDALNPGDLIAEVGTDKATVDFECQDSGYMAKILVPDGTADVQVGRIIAIMVDTADVVAAFQAVPAELLTGEGAAPLTAAPPAPAAAPAARAPAAAPVAAPAAATPSFAAPSQAASAASAGGRVIASPLAKKVR
jgi:pyruvate dehydrogenase E2 component (dihydrolipoamide acetyltransferase)